MEKSSKIKGIIVLVIAIIGFIVIFAKSGLVGLVIYLISAAISLFSIPKEERSSVPSIMAYVKDTLKQISGETLLSNDIFAIVLAILPIAIAAGLFVIFYIDPIRAAEKAIDGIFDSL